MVRDQRSKITVADGPGRPTVNFWPWPGTMAAGPATFVRDDPRIAIDPPQSEQPAPGPSGGDSLRLLPACIRRFEPASKTATREEISISPDPKMSILRASIFAEIAILEATSPEIAARCGSQEDIPGPVYRLPDVDWPHGIQAQARVRIGPNERTVRTGGRESSQYDRACTAGITCGVSIGDDDAGRLKNELYSSAFDGAVGGRREFDEARTRDAA